MQQTPDTALLESIARATSSSFEQVLALFERERDALASTAKVPNYVTLLAVRRVRRQLMSTRRH